MMAMTILNTKDRCKHGYVREARCPMGAPVGLPCGRKGFTRSSDDFKPTSS